MAETTKDANIGSSDQQDFILRLMNEEMEVILQCRIREDNHSICYNDPNHFIYLRTLYQDDEILKFDEAGTGIQYVQENEPAKF